MNTQTDTSRSAKQPFNHTFDEYKLSIETQMHFNEILMKFRSFGIAAVVAIYSYAITRDLSNVPLSLQLVQVSQAQLVACAGVFLAIGFAAIDFLYFFPLLLGAVDRSTTIEEFTAFRLTSSITLKVSRKRAYLSVILIYTVILIAGLILVFLLSPSPSIEKATVSDLHI